MNNRRNFIRRKRRFLIFPDDDNGRVIDSRIKRREFGVMAFSQFSEEKIIGLFEALDRE